jgi:hypothetical protein
MTADVSDPSYMQPEWPECWGHHGTFADDQLSGVGGGARRRKQMVEARGLGM